VKSHHWHAAPPCRGLVSEGGGPWSCRGPIEGEVSCVGVGGAAPPRVNGEGEVGASVTASLRPFAASPVSEGVGVLRPLAADLVRRWAASVSAATARRSLEAETGIGRYGWDRHRRPAGAAIAAVLW
jgi:hypothetical protein